MNQPALPKGRILVIDDEADIRESLETLLCLEGYTVELAQNGGDGLRRAEARQLRHDPAGSDDAGSLRHGSAARDSRARLGDADLHDHRLWVGGSGGDGAQERRERLFL